MLLKEPSLPYTYASSDDEEDPEEFTDTELTKSTYKIPNWSYIATKRTQSCSSAVEEFSRALSSVHMNQRVLSTNIKFTEQDHNKQKYEPTLTIDGVPYIADTNTLGALEEITISRAFKY